MKKLTLLHLKSAFWFGMAFMSFTPWFALVCGLVGTLSLGFDFWWSALFGLGVVFMGSLAAFLLGLIYPNEREDQYISIINVAKGVIGINSLGVVRFKK